MEPSTLTIQGIFTKNSGQPATGLDLADIDFKLTRIDKSGGDELVIWTSQVAEAEIGTSGIYYALYDEALLDSYNYFSIAHYVGGVTLDTDYYSKVYYNV